MDPKRLLEQFLGPDAASKAGAALGAAKGRLDRSGMGGAAGVAAAGGVLALLLGSKTARRAAGGIVGYGGAAALGAMALRAWQGFEAGKGGEPATGSALPPPPPPAGSKFLPATAPAADGRPFELALLLAMIGAANADGHIDSEERGRIFEKAAKLPLDPEDKAFLFDAIAKPPALGEIAAMAAGPEQAAEIWLAARLSIDPDRADERAWLDGLAARLGLAPGLAARLEAEAAALG